MKNTTFLLLMIALVMNGCTSSDSRTVALEQQVVALEQRVNDQFVPGFGEFMSTLQVHHAKLWFAGEAGNWPLAEFEVHELGEALDDIKKYQTERKESELVVMLDPALDSVRAAIQKADPVLFRSSYTLLTNTCNTCHQATNFAFNVVKVPDTPPFSNQVFKP
ncbi:MAG: hypothetical protein JNJ91_09080 [Flavobacteriales bacterium]|nr:hypothetical protein [Flavobacteriales bacterium]